MRCGGDDFLVSLGFDDLEEAFTFLWGSGWCVCAGL